MDWEIIVLDSELNYIGSIDDYESFIWNSRFKEPGDFELYFGNSENAFKLLQVDNFIYCKNIDETTKNIYPYYDQNQYINEFSHGYPLMIIENLETEYSVENGIHLKVTGRSAEVILERRVAYATQIFSGDHNDILPGMIPMFYMTNITSPIGPKYFFNKDNYQAPYPSLSNGMSYENLYLSKDIDGQGTPETLSTNIYTNFYDFFSYLSNRFGFGMRLCVLDNEYPQIQLYFPVDRTLEKGHSMWKYEKEQPIIFSDKDGSVISSTYKINYENYRNNAYCMTRMMPGGISTTHNSAYPENVNNVPNYKQRWVYKNNVPAIISTSQDPSVDNSAYMRSYMRYILATQYAPITEFEMEFDTENSQYKINKDYYLGDYVQVENSYGISAVAQVTEVLYSVSASDGFRIIPKFEIIQ